MSNKVLPAKIVRLVAIIAAVTSVACADRMTSPSPIRTRAKATLDSVQGDTTTCLFGYVIMGGWYRCS